MRFLDANIFLRALAEPRTESDQRKARAATTLFHRLAVGEESATTAEAILTEVAYVLRSPRQYGLQPAEITARLRPIVTLRGLHLTHKRTYLRALDLWDAYPRLDFEDVLAVAHMERLRVADILSYDTDFDQVAGVRRVEP